MVEFNPGSWRQAGSAVENAGRSFQSEVQGALGGVQNTGADGGITMIDGLIAGILPAVMEAVNETVTGIANGLQSEGASLVDTGDAYEEMEEAAASVGGVTEEDLAWL